LPRIADGRRGGPDHRRHRPGNRVRPRCRTTRSGIRQHGSCWPSMARSESGIASSLYSMRERATAAGLERTPLSPPVPPIPVPVLSRGRTDAAFRSCPGPAHPGEWLDTRPPEFRPCNHPGSGRSKKWHAAAVVPARLSGSPGTRLPGRTCVPACRRPRADAHWGWDQERVGQGCMAACLDDCGRLRSLWW